jgi:predicted metalloprotease with PDZ domain
VAELPKGNPEFLRYRQGMMAAWMLDVELLKASGGRAGFRELMRLLLARHAGTDGLTRAEVREAIRTLGGARVAALFDPLTDITRPIDFPSHLVGSGISLSEKEGTRSVNGGKAPRGAERRFLTRWFTG